VAYALAGTTDIDLATEPIGQAVDGASLKLADIWPTQKEIAEIEATVGASMFQSSYGNVFDGNPEWNAIPVKGRRPLRLPRGLDLHPGAALLPGPHEGAAAAPRHRGRRVLALLGDSVTTDHISPAGDIALKSPAGRYLVEHGASKQDFNSYGSRRGNDRVMVRGTFANIRLKNAMVPGSRAASPSTCRRESRWTSSTRPSATRPRARRSW
jgi:aconitate hydratase